MEQASTPPPAEEGAPLWTVTFGDMMSLLLTFFILLFSMSEIKVEKFLLASESLREAMGGTARDPIDDPLGLMPDEVDPDLELQNPSAGTGSDAWKEALADAYMDVIASQMSELVDERGLHETFEVVQEGDGIYLRVRSSALFESGRAALNPGSRVVLDDLASLTGNIDIRLVVSGHADNVPIRGGTFASNWELSAARAAGVARVLVVSGQSPELVRVESYGEFKPIASNDTREGRSQNRRVEFSCARQDIIGALEAWIADDIAATDDPATTASGPAS